jgi:diacylglycerol kinase (ATP)
MSPAKMCVIHNPTSGRGRGKHRLERLRRDLGERADFWPTAGPGQAEELALRAAREGFAVVAAAGGDGTVHEVANGLLRAGRPETVLAVFPIGSANDYAHSLGLPPHWWQHADPAIGPRAVDAGLVRSGERSRYFVNGLGLGFNGAVTLESRRIKHLQGLALYGVALFRALLFRYRHPLVTVTLDGQQRSVPTLALSLAIGRREGNFVVAPEACLDDGLFDYLHAGPLPRRALLPFLPGLFAGRFRPVHPSVWMGRCEQAVVHSQEPLTVHVDGEFFCTPDDGVHDLEVTLLPGALRVIGRLPALREQPASSRVPTSPGENGAAR